MSERGHRGPDLAARIEEARAIVLGLTDTLLAAREGHELAAAVTALQSLTSTTAALTLSLLAELEATGATTALGWASTRDFATAVGGGHRSSGPAAVRLAADLGRPVFATVAEALRDGWLSSVKAQVITGAVGDLPSTADHRRAVSVMLEEATRLDATDLRRLGRHLVSVVDPVGEDRRAEAALERQERAAHAERFLCLTEDGAGGARIRGRCSAEDAATIRSTLTGLSAPRPAAGPGCDPRTCAVPGCSHDGRDPRDHGARTLDALVELCHRGQSASLLPQAHGAAPRVSVTLEYDALRAALRSRGRAGTLTEDGVELSAGTLRRLCCDAEVIPVVLGSASEVLDVGRSSRLVTAVIWKALVVRDAHCRFPGCTRPPVMCHAHHLRHWADGGPTSLANLVLLCGHHHRLVHSGPWRVAEVRGGPPRFIPPPGTDRSRVGVRPDVPDRRPPPGCRGG